MMNPFSTGTEAMNWMCNNCDTCKRAYLPKKGENKMPDYEETKKLIELGRECVMKLDLEMGFISGEIPISSAKLIGQTESGLKESCMMHIERTSRDWDEDYPPKKPIDTIPDNQLCFPFIMDELIGQGAEGETSTVKVSGTYL